MEKLSFDGRVRSFRFAFSGILTMLATQQNAWIHLAATIVVVAIGFKTGIDANQWCLLVLAAVLVWAAEALNTAFEFLTDVASPEFHPLAAKAKDVAAGAVLIAAIGSVVIGLLVFGPRLFAVGESLWR